jgi:hypothetical protein
VALVGIEPATSSVISNQTKRANHGANQTSIPLRLSWLRTRTPARKRSLLGPKFVYTKKNRAVYAQSIYKNYTAIAENSRLAQWQVPNTLMAESWV